MKYSSGNMGAYAKARKSKNIEKYNAYIVGSGVSALATAFFLIRDAHMDGEKIHIFKKSSGNEGAWERSKKIGKGNIIEVGEELDLHFETLYDILRDIPSIDTKGASVLDEIVWINKDYPNKPKTRCTDNRSEDLFNEFHFSLSDEGITNILKFYTTPDSELFDKEIKDVLSEDVLNSTFWFYWSNMFYFAKKDSALELKRYLRRFLYDMHDITDKRSSFTCKYTVSESIVVPLVEFLKKKGVDFRSSISIEDVKFSITPEESLAEKIIYKGKDGAGEIHLTDKDLIFITLGSAAENATPGSQDEAAEFIMDLADGGSWELWRNIAKQNINFGNPDKFCDEPSRTKFVTSTITTLDEKIPQYISNVARRDPFCNEPITGGNITMKDSPWGLNWCFPRQPALREQKEGELVGTIYGITPDNLGAYVNKKMMDCSGKEICEEWLYHMGVPEEDIEDMASNSANTVPLIVPFLMSYLIPRAEGDRPKVVPEGSKNFAFIGQFSRITGHTAFSLENATRTAMESVYTLLPIDRDVPEVWASSYDLRDILSAFSAILDGKSLNKIKLSSKSKKFLKNLMKFAYGNEIQDILEDYNIVEYKK